MGKMRSCSFKADISKMVDWASISAAIRHTEVPFSATNAHPNSQSRLGCQAYFFYAGTAISGRFGSACGRFEDLFE
jgi:hypothetical protein